VWCRQHDGGHGSRNPHKECVTTHLQNHTAPKMDGAQAVTTRYKVVYKIARHLTFSYVYINFMKSVGGTRMDIIY